MSEHEISILLRQIRRRERYADFEREGTYINHDIEDAYQEYKENN